MVIRGRGAGRRRGVDGVRRRRAARVAVGLALLVPAAACTVAEPAPAPSSSPLADREQLPYLDPDLPVDERVEDLLGRMELADKVGQMTQGERSVATPDVVRDLRLGSVLSGGGSVPDPNTAQGWADMVDALQEGALATPLGIPVLYGTDAVHGHNNLVGATVFPHNIGLGATRDPDLVERIGRATAAEVAASGAQWTFAPCVCVVRDDRWGRSYESFGEAPEIAVGMTSVITGLQGATLGGDDEEGPFVLATAKHYLADGGTAGGVDQGDATVGEAELREIHLPPFEAAVERGVGSVMVSFSSWRGDKLHGHRYLITDVLKDELGFEGFVVSDWAGIDQLDGREGFTRAEVAEAVNAGVDMIMVPYEVEELVAALTAAVEAGDVPLERVDDAVRRILTVKVRMGLFEHPFADRSGADVVGSDEHRALAREAVAASQVVLTNDGALPLEPGARVLVAGSNADDVGHQSGGWTVTWQGVSGDALPGTTVLEGLREVLGEEAVTALAPGGRIDADEHDVAVVVVGETPYAEFEGDRPDGVVLSEADLATLEAVRATGLPTVLVVVSGRPMDITAQLDWVDAAVAAWLPGSEGGGVADVLAGVVDPTGTLPVSWPRGTGEVPVNDGDGVIPLFALGHGLTY